MDKYNGVALYIQRNIEQIYKDPMGPEIAPFLRYMYTDRYMVPERKPYLDDEIISGSRNFQFCV
jgi:hypothetical protein